MSDDAGDIVERLESWPAVHKNSDAFSNTFVGGLMNEAAKEIERLRKALHDVMNAENCPYEVARTALYQDDGGEK